MKLNMVLNRAAFLPLILSKLTAIPLDTGGLFMLYLIMLASHKLIGSMLHRMLTARNY